MFSNPKPGNQPDRDDMSGTFENVDEVHNKGTGHPDLDAEDEAAKLGDFA
jgi:hypothetical protein